MAKQQQPQQPPAIIELPCGCKVGYSQVMRSCETARQLYREINVANVSGQTDLAERAGFNYEEHFTEQLEAMEAEQ